MKSLLKKIIQKFYREKIVFVKPEIKASKFPPVFVFGVHRSGTTLLRLILDSHSNLVCPLESMFLAPLSSVIEEELSIKGLKGMGFSEEHVKAKIKEFSDYFFETYANSRGKRRWVDKCPHYVDNMDFIDSIYGPECRYILIFRHGLDVACSVAQMPIEPAERFKVECGDPYIGSARYWSEQCRKLIVFKEKVGDRGITIFYEELLDNPESIIKSIFRHINEPWEEQVLKFYDYDHCRSPGLEDPKASWSKGFKKSTENWKKLDPKIVAQMEKETMNELNILGYSLDSSTRLK